MDEIQEAVQNIDLQQTIEISTTGTTILIIILIMKVNHYLNSCELSNSSQKWDLVESIFAIIFGWIGLLYLLINNSGEIFSFCTESKREKVREKKAKKQRKKEEKEAELRQEDEEDEQENHHEPQDRTRVTPKRGNFKVKA